MKRPKLILVGGANGSGKTTLAREFIAEENLAYLGADDIAREINPDKPEAAAIEAARVFSGRFDDYLERRESFIVESTLSGLSLKKRIDNAGKLGYWVKILFVYLDSAELCVERVAARVAKGGHHVPDEDVMRRFGRANRNFRHVYKDSADEWNLFYNAGVSIFQVAGGDRNAIIVLDNARFEQWQKMVTK